MPAGNSSLPRILLALACLCAPAMAHAADDPGRPPASSEKEFRVKAAFLFNFAKFVEWPDAAFADAQAPLVIGILGADPFGHMLDDTVAGETIGGRRIEIRRSHDPAELKDCQLVYASRFEARNVGDLLAAFADAPVLTVSGIDGFCAAGGIIQFYIESGKVRFLINQGRAQALGLKLSAQLLGVGKIYVEPGGKR
jgi:hypothetical protein